MSKPRDDLDFSRDTEFGEELLRKLKAQMRCEELSDDDLDWVSAAGDLAAEQARRIERKDEGGPSGRHTH